jgi:hypothetical protein
MTGLKRKDSGDPNYEQFDCAILENFRRLEVLLVVQSQIFEGHCQSTYSLHHGVTIGISPSGTAGRLILRLEDQ